MFRSSEIRQCDVEVIVTNKLVLKARVSNTIIIICERRLTRKFAELFIF